MKTLLDFVKNNEFKCQALICIMKDAMNTVFKTLNINKLAS